MLGLLYNDTITVKIPSGQDEWGQAAFTTTTIAGCLQPSTKRQIDNNGNIITSNALLNTLNDLAMNSKITYNGKDYEIQRKDTVKNHLTNQLDHYEYLF